MTIEQLRESIEAVVSYALDDEETDAARMREENGDDDGHIVHHLRRLSAFLGD